jgi:3-dehydrosphinganine reductase
MRRSRASRKRRWRDAWAVITGGSSGIGLATAERLVAAGANVVLLARRRAPLERAATALAPLRTAPSQQVRASVCDVAVQTDVQRIFADLAGEGIALDLLVNSAGVVHPGRIEDLDGSIFEETLRVNVLGTVHCVRGALPLLRPHSGAQIANVSSLAGLLGIFGYTAYSASKFAIVGFSEALRCELAPRGIGVSVLCPPDTETPQLAAERTLRPPETAALAASARVLTPGAVADALLAGLARHRFLIVPGWENRLTASLKRWAPGIVARVIDAQVRRARA